MGEGLPPQNPGQHYITSAEHLDLMRMVMVHADKLTVCPAGARRVALRALLEQFTETQRRVGLRPDLWTGGRPGRKLQLSIMAGERTGTIRFPNVVLIQVLCRVDRARRLRSRSGDIHASPLPFLFLFRGLLLIRGVLVCIVVRQHMVLRRSVRPAYKLAEF